MACPCCIGSCCVGDECSVSTAEACAAVNGIFRLGGNCDGPCPCVQQVPGTACIPVLSEPLSALFCSPLIFPPTSCTGGTISFGVFTPRVCRFVIEELTGRAGGFGTQEECSPFANIKVIRSRVGRPPEEGEPWLAVGAADRSQIIGSVVVDPFTGSIQINDVTGISPSDLNEEAVNDLAPCGGIWIVKDEIRLIGNQADVEHVTYALDGSPITLSCRRYKTRYRAYLGTGEEVTSQVTNYPEMLWEGTVCGNGFPPSLNGTGECVECGLPGFGGFSEFFPDVVFPCAANPLP